MRSGNRQCFFSPLDSKGTAEARCKNSAGSAAKGTTEVHRIEHIKRGYENIDRYQAPANSRSCYRKIDTDSVALSSIASYISNHATITGICRHIFTHFLRIPHLFKPLHSQLSLFLRQRPQFKNKGFQLSRSILVARAAAL
ncbi:hypothetical protein V6N12_003942 [Hibiscus sabdariffa]|uniref:Uncharacterized protein n=1 Tax=Hibiscus sabdariffa TaxID=183260 RepID=A0ABR2CK07_9ROSI